MAKEAKKKEKKMKDNTNKKDSKKEKRHFFKDVKAELKKVIWPTPKQLFNNTLAVIVSVIIVGVIVFLLDLCFEKINTFGIEKLKTVVQSSQNEEAENVLSDTSTENDAVEDSNTDSAQENVESSVEDENTDSAHEDVDNSGEDSNEDNTDSAENAE